MNDQRKNEQKMAWMASAFLAVVLSLLAVIVIMWDITTVEEQLWSMFTGGALLGAGVGILLGSASVLQMWKRSKS